MNAWAVLVTHDFPPLLPGAGGEHGDSGAAFLGTKGHQQLAALQFDRHAVVRLRRDVAIRGGQFSAFRRSAQRGSLEAFHLARAVIE
ncbi:hypothetical protein AB4Y88_05365 [Paenarthrobacter sp. RAF9]